MVISDWLYSHTPEDKIEKGIHILGDTLKEAMARS